MTENIYRKIYKNTKSRSKRVQALFLISFLRDAQVEMTEEGDIVIFCQFPHARIGVIIREHEEESSWFFVTDSSVGGIAEYGYLNNLLDTEENKEKESGL